jgi:hypothetical protein
VYRYTTEDRNARKDRDVGKEKNGLQERLLMLLEDPPPNSLAHL